MFTDNINNLTPTFRDAVEDFIPKWLESFVPHYHQAKVKNVDYADLSNVIFPDGEHYELNEFHYIYRINGSGLAVLSLDATYKHYTRTGFRECIITMFPALDYAPDPSMGKFSELFNNALYFDHYLWRAFNRKTPYDDMMNRMNDYFRRLTGDDTVGISLSDRPMLYFNPRAKAYINNYYALH